MDPEVRGLMRLLTPPGPALLADLPPIHSPADVLAITNQLRQVGHDPELIAAALTQQRLRAKAASKFGPFAADLYYTTAGLEQATRLEVATRHAQRFRTAGCRRIADLGCGIGAESLAFAGLGLDVLAVDMDEAHAALALLNLRQFPGVTVRQQRIEDTDLSDVDGAFADPARRDEHGRINHPEEWSPSLSTILGLREQVPNLGVKVAPGIHYEDLPHDAHVQWTSVQGELVEAAIWCGELAAEGPGRSALVLSDAGAVAISATAGTGAPLTDPTQPAAQVPAGELGDFIHDVDPAVLRAGALATAADHLDAHLVSDAIAYLTSDKDAAGWAGTRSYRVTDVLPANAKKLRGELRRRHIGRLEILKRGTAVDPARLRKQLALKGEESATLIMTRVQGRHSALLVERGVSVSA